MEPQRISVYADGSSCGSKPGPIGWGFVVVNFTTGLIVSYGQGGLPEGTNNQAELLGGIRGLEYVLENGLHVGNAVELVSDSQYCLGLASGQFDATKNLDLAAVIRELMVKTGARTKWVRGHNGDMFNEFCDQRAKDARWALLPEKEHAKKQRRKLTKRAVSRAAKEPK